MPFQDVYLALYERLKINFAEDFRFEHADDFEGNRGHQSILRDIIKGIHDADVIIADLSGLNANVLYELGISHALTKKVIHITQNIEEMPFDIRAYRAIEYSTRFDLIDKMDGKIFELMNSIRDGSGEFNNPVTDYLPISSSSTVCEITTNVGTKSLSLLGESSIPPDNDLSENTQVEQPDVLDCAIEIHENSKKLTLMLVGIAEKLAVMTEDISEGTKKIDIANKSGGSGTASHIRQISQKIALTISNFSVEMGTFNDGFKSRWDNIDEAYRNILNNAIMLKPENIDTIKNNAESMRTLNNTMKTAKMQFENMGLSVEGIIGFERRLTQSAKRLLGEVHRFIELLEISISSTERIYELSITRIEELQKS